MIVRYLKVLWVFILAFILSGCASQKIISDGAAETIKLTSVVEQEAPIAIVSLAGTIVSFECLDTREDCLPDFDVSDYALLDWPYHLGPVYYCSPSSIFLILYSSNNVPWERSVLHYDPQTKKVISTKLPRELEFLNSTTVGGRLVLVGDHKNTVYILDEDLSTRKIEVGSSINKIIGANTREVIALNEQPFEKNSDYFVEVYVIDIVSGQFAERHLKLPGLELGGLQSTPQTGKKYLIIVEGISRDLNYLYALYYYGDAPNTVRLGTFDIKNLKEVASTQDPDLVRITSGYAQYHEFFYANSTLINMSTVSSLLDFSSNPELKQGRQHIPVPFGDFFLLSLVDRAVVRLTQNGKVLELYPLPDEWNDKDYRVMYYIK